MAEFFLGIRLSADLEIEIENWRRLLGAPRTVAHITVIPPFTWEGSTRDLITLLEKSAASFEAFGINGQGIGSFGSRVLFVNVTLTNELDRLHSKLIQTLGEKGIIFESRKYNPHITLASRLDQARFGEYKEKLENYTPSYDFLCQAITLFEFTRSQGWQPLTRIPLGALV